MMYQTKILSIKNLAKIRFAQFCRIGPDGVAAAKPVDLVHRQDQENAIRVVRTLAIQALAKHRAAMYGSVKVRFLSKNHHKLCNITF